MPQRIVALADPAAGGPALTPERPRHPQCDRRVFVDGLRPVANPQRNQASFQLRPYVVRPHRANARIRATFVRLSCFPRLFRHRRLPFRERAGCRCPKTGK
jgi:hypothetical protein